MVGNVQIGGQNKVVIQSMCNTKTKDIESTVTQILQLEEAGCEIIRVACLDLEDAKAIKEIKNIILFSFTFIVDFITFYKKGENHRKSGNNRTENRKGPAHRGQVPFLWQIFLRRGQLTRPSSSASRSARQRTSRRSRTASRRARGRSGAGCCNGPRP